MKHQPSHLRIILAIAVFSSSMTAAKETPLAIDFTDSDQWGSASVTTRSQTYLSSLTVTATSSSSLTFNAPFDGKSCPAGLACHGDGLEISPGDEIIHDLGVGEWLHVLFSDAVVDISLGFIDLYAAGSNPSHPESEVAL